MEKAVKIWLGILVVIALIGIITYITAKIPNTKMNTMSIITPPGTNYQSIIFDISVTNNGNVPADFWVVDAAPQLIKDNLPKGYLNKQSLNPGQTAHWYSNAIDPTLFGEQSINFNASIVSNFPISQYIGDFEGFTGVNWNTQEYLTDGWTLGGASGYFSYEYGGKSGKYIRMPGDTGYIYKSVGVVTSGSSIYFWGKLDPEAYLSGIGCYYVAEVATGCRTPNNSYDLTGSGKCNPSLTYSNWTLFKVVACASGNAEIRLGWSHNGADYDLISIGNSASDATKVNATTVYSGSKQFQYFKGICFRTSNLGYGYDNNIDGTPNGIAFDPNCTGNLTKYGYQSSYTSSGYTCDSQYGTRLMNIPFNKRKDSGGIFSGGNGNPGLYRYTDYPDKIAVCETDADGSGYKLYYYRRNAANPPNVDMSLTSVDIRSENYGYLLGSCYDGIKTTYLGETDVDCGGSSCKKCEYGRTCSANSDCYSNICSLTCQAGTRQVKVRVATNNYNYGSPCSSISQDSTNQEWLALNRKQFVKFRTNPTAVSTADFIDGGIAVTNTCGSILVKAGEYGGGYGSSGSMCGGFMPTECYSGNCFQKLFDITNGVSNVTRGSYRADSGFSLWWRDLGNSIEYGVCGDEGGGYRAVYVLFRQDVNCGASQAECYALSNSPNPTTPSNEMTCNTAGCYNPSQLTSYGKSTYSHIASGRCTNLGTLIATLPYITNIRYSLLDGCRLNWDTSGSPIGDGTAYLYYDSSENVYQCENDLDGAGYAYVKFTTTDSDVQYAQNSTIETTGFEDREVYC
jgi:hypothetical protein